MAVQSTSVFITAAEARQNPRREMTIHEEACGIQTAILNAVNLGLYEATVSDGTPMTDSNPPVTDVWTVNSATDEFYVPDHNLKTGDAVTLQSTVTLPAPLNSTSYYYVIYVSQDYIKLAQTYADSIAGRPVYIDITSGVTNVSVTNPGTGYLQAPVVSMSGGSPTTPASLRSYLSTWGNVVDVSIIGTGAGYVDQPTVSIEALGSGATTGNVSYMAVGAVVQNAGYDYHIGDILSVVGGVGTATTAKITGVDNAGTVLSVIVVNPGSYTTLPTTSGVATTVSPGGGAAATLNLTMGIKSIALTSGGSGYVAAPKVTINSNTGVGALGTVSIYGGEVSEITITNPGYGYLDVSSVSINSGSGATGVAMLMPTTVTTGIVTNNGGNTYTSPPAVSINARGTGAVAGTVTMKVVAAQLTSGGVNYKAGDILLISGGIALVNSWIRVASVNSVGSIIGYVLEEGGSYTSLPGLVANPVNGGNGTLAAFNLLIGVNSIAVSLGGSNYFVPPIVTIADPANGGTTATTDAIITSGSVTEFLITNAGFNYEAVPSVTISNGSGATASAILTPTTLSSIGVASAGSGYTTANVTITGGGASVQATGNVVLSGGSVAAINVLTPGSGYTTLPTITINGDGTGAAGTPMLTNTSVSSISINAQGSGYNTPPLITITGAATAVSLLAGTGIQRIAINSQGSNYSADPIVQLVPGTYQGTTPIAPALTAQRAFSVSSIGVISAGEGYQSAPTLTLTGPYYSTGIQATAVAYAGPGLGTFTLTPYETSNDYFKAWKGQQLSNNALSRPYINQMDAIIAYFSNLGYSINRLTNPATNNTLMWKILW